MVAPKSSFAIILLTIVCVASTAKSQPVTLTNDIPGDARWSVAADNGGGTNSALLDAVGPLSELDVIFNYNHYIDAGAAGVLDLKETTITQQISGDSHLAVSRGEFAGPNGTVQWTATSALPVNSQSYFVRLDLQSAQPFGQLRFIQYLDEDVQGISDDLLVVVGTPGAADFQLLTVDGANAVGVAHGAFNLQATNMTFGGWAADRFPLLREAITTGGATFSPAGNINTANLPLAPDPRYPGLPVYGQADVTTALAMDLNPNATNASVTVYLGGSPEGQPVIPTPPPGPTPSPTPPPGPTPTPPIAAPGPEDEPLRPPVFTKFNTFLGQLNFLELVNAGSAAMSVDVFLHNLRGQVMTATAVPLAPRSQFDLDINTLVQQTCASNPIVCAGFTDLDGNGVVDTYGLLRLEFDQSDPNKILLGRMSQYRPDPGGVGTFSFAFARELRNPAQGSAFAVGNTFDPQGMGFLVPNWVEVINLAGTRQSFTYNLYSQDGALIFTNRFSVDPLGERDVQGGHEITAGGRVVEGVYLIEVIPDDPNINYLLYVSRYSSNSPAGVEPTTYNYAFSLDGRSGAPVELFAPISNEQNQATCSTTTNWVEVVNTSASAVGFNIIFRDPAGAVLQNQPWILAPRSQFHFNASTILGLSRNSRGSAQVVPAVPGTLLTQSLVYVHQCDANAVASAYVVPGIRSGAAVQTGTANTFLDMDDDLMLISAKGTTAAVSFSLQSFTGFNAASALNLPAFGSDVIRLSDPPTEFPQNSYGVLTVNSTAAQEVLGLLRRIRIAPSDGRNRVDFVMPTRIR